MRSELSSFHGPGVGIAGNSHRSSCGCGTHGGTSSSRISEVLSGIHGSKCNTLSRRRGHGLFSTDRH